MKKYTLVSLLIFTALFMQLLSCSPTVKVVCSDGETYRQYKDPAKNFPDYAKTFDDAVKVTLNVMDSINVTADITLKNKITEFREKLNQNNIIIQDLIKANFLMYNNAICDKDTRDHYYEFQKFITARVFQIAAANAELKTISDLKSTDEQKKLLGDMALIDNQVNSIVMTYAPLDNSPNSSTNGTDTTKKSKKNIKLFITYHDKYIDNSNLIFNGIVKAFSTSQDAEFQYFFLKEDRDKSDFEIVVSSTSIDGTGTTYEDESCDYTYSFTLFEINKKNGSLASVGSGDVKSKFCKEPAREEDIANKFKDISNILLQKMLQK